MQTNMNYYKMKVILLNLSNNKKLQMNINHDLHTPQPYS